MVLVEGLHKTCKINDLQDFCFLGIPGFTALYGCVNFGISVEKLGIE